MGNGGEGGSVTLADGLLRTECGGSGVGSGSEGISNGSCQVLACELDGARRELRVPIGSKLVLGVR